MYNSDGYVLIDLSDVDMSLSTQHLNGIYKRVLDVIDTNKLALIINAGNNTPMAAIVHKRLNYYVINTTLYIFTINSNDIIIIEEAGTATVDVEIVPTLLSGVKIADFAIGDQEGSLYAPEAESEINDNIQTDHTTWSSDKIESELSAKADSADVYTKSQVDNALSAKADSADVYTKSQVDNALSAKADSATTYTKTEVDTALSAKANTSDITDIFRNLQGNAPVNINDCVAGYVYWASTYSGIVYQNLPSTGAYTVLTFKPITTHGFQIAIPNGVGKIWIRTMANGSWSNWKYVLLT